VFLLDVAVTRICVSNY